MQLIERFAAAVFDDISGQRFLPWFMLIGNFHSQDRSKTHLAATKFQRLWSCRKKENLHIVLNDILRSMYTSVYKVFMEQEKITFERCARTTARLKQDWSGEDKLPEFKEN